MKNRTINNVLVVLLSAMSGYGEILVTLSSDGSVWKADSSDVNGTKIQMASLPGTGYIDATADEYYLYGLRGDGTVYRADLNGNVSQISLTGWSSSIAYINADSGILYGMNSSGNADVLKTDGSVAVHISNATATWGDFTVTEDNRIWLLNTSGGARAWAYGFTNGYSGTLSGNSGFVNFNSSLLGLALISAGNELYCAYDSGTSVSIARTSGDATSKSVFISTESGLADMLVGGSLYAVNTNGSAQVVALDTAAETALGTLGSTVVGIALNLKPVATVKLFVVY